MRRYLLGPISAFACSNLENHKKLHFGWLISQLHKTTEEHVNVLCYNKRDITCNETSQLIMQDKQADSLTQQCVHLIKA
jgi:hypothetical protein